MKLTITAFLLLCGALGWTLKQNWDANEKLLYCQQVKESIPDLIGQYQYQACIVTISYMCNKRVNCDTFSVEDMQQFCAGAKEVR